MGKMEGRFGIFNRLLNCRRLRTVRKFLIFLDILLFLSSNGDSSCKSPFAVQGARVPREGDSPDNQAETI